ncbi:hypothetical protein B566_EDAN013081 [Ephemera danica]|nr:hypothetical protein B566_EDAN013081 [Ephemera danica]
MSTKLLCIALDNFDTIDTSKWSHEITMAELGVPNLSRNVWKRLHEERHLTLRPRCTQPNWYGCYREGSADNYLNPITSSSLSTTGKFSFTYGQVEVRAKMPAGDWLWPAIWLKPQDNIYGEWPKSGEININEARGNRHLTLNGRNIGVEQAASTLNWVVNWSQNQFRRTHWELNRTPGFDADFHVYRLVWTPGFIAFYIDNREIGRVNPPAGGFYELGQLTGPNPWVGGSKMAPFDVDFHLILNLACGGTNGYFPENARNPGGKPWRNSLLKSSGMVRVNGSPLGARTLPHICRLTTCVSGRCKCTNRSRVELQ